jgi:A/G-specific adenine glycosylase
LPWRTGPAGTRDGFATLVSEVMLQQTQASRVAERFPRVLARFPTPAALADADEAELLALWSGLGYYRRARGLHAAAREIVSRFGGRVPQDVGSLRSLPGVGRYTAGAVASIAFGRAEPVVDGNVTRVLLRLHGRDLDPAEAGASAWVWDRAGELVGAAERPGVLNEALMELGAVVCTPRNPACEKCPLADRCVARRAGSQGRIPRPKPAPARATLHAAVAVVLDARGRVLVERRPATGLWAGLWQAPTLESRSRAPAAGRLARHAGAVGLRRAESFVFRTTHREVRFVVYRGTPTPGVSVREGAAWVGPAELVGLGVSSPQRGLIERALGADGPC